MEGFYNQEARFKQALKAIFDLPVVEKQPSDSITCFIYLTIESYVLSRNNNYVTINATIQLIDSACSKANGYLLYKSAVNAKKYSNKFKLVDNVEKVINIDAYGNKMTQLAVIWIDDFNLTESNEPMREASPS